ncbi:unnamed protein product [Enterobius vermicularis]|uniref:Cytochrome c domain-containing protein n=1 Tax=Enterobius vermicularis TaxID=51028 RepID=A0A0N4VDP1_ENTVE|nr:unnamed protein product [Enterobius vermicularis]
MPAGHFRKIAMIEPAMELSDGDIKEILYFLNGSILAKENLGQPSQGRYSSIGFSNDAYMGDDTVLECVFDPQGHGSVFISYNGASSNRQLLEASKIVLKNKKAAIQDGKMVCSVEFLPREVQKVPASERKKIHDLNSKGYMIQYAKGLADPHTLEKQSHGMVEGDEFYPWSTTRRVRFCENCSDKLTIVTEMQQ